jgi:hypothetical protein
VLLKRLSEALDASSVNRSDGRAEAAEAAEELTQKLEKPPESER